jgi:hypothetical protein
MASPVRRLAVLISERAQADVAVKTGIVIGSLALMRAYRELTYAPCTSVMVHVLASRCG